MASKKKCICLILPTLGPGGMERVMSELARYFDQKADTEIHLVLFGRTRKIFYSIPSSIAVHKPKFTFNNDKRFWHTIKTLLFIRREINSIKPDVILSFGEDWNNLVLLACLGLNYPICVSDRAEPGLERRKVQEILSKLLYQTSSGIIVQTEVAKSIYENIYSHKNIVAIGNPIRKVLDKNNLPEREKIILSVGRLVDTKHFDLLIRIFNKIETPDWKLIIVGGDSQRQNVSKELRALIAKLGLRSKVELTGTVSNVEDYYKKSSIFAFTSSSEGFPNVIGEAMSAGLPIVAFDCVAGPSELVDNGGNGYLIPLFETEEFAEKLMSLVKNETLRLKMGKKSLDKIKDFSIERIGEKYFQFLIDQI